MTMTFGIAGFCGLLILQFYTVFVMLLSLPGHEIFALCPK